jgi:hypothetical protein
MNLIGETTAQPSSCHLPQKAETSEVERTATGLAKVEILTAVGEAIEFLTDLRIHTMHLTVNMVVAVECLMVLEAITARHGAQAGKQRTTDKMVIGIMADHDPLYHLLQERVHDIHYL